MRLMDVRRLAVKKRLRISFQMSNGRTCVVNEGGTAQVTDLRDVPDFNVEGELASATEFVLDPAAPAGKGKSESKPRTLSRAGLLEIIGSAAAADPAGHEDE